MFLVMAEGGVCTLECCERGRAPWGVGRCLGAWTSGSKPGTEKKRRGEAPPSRELEDGPRNGE